jgi:uncharacterized protein
MIRVVIDTNVVVSSRLRPEGQPALIVNLAMDRRIEMITSAEIWAEYTEVLFRPKFKLDPQLVTTALQVISSNSVLVTPKRKARKATDVKDNRFLAAAAVGKAAFLITGNTRHFPKRYGRTSIVTPSEFINIVGPMLALPTSH